MQREGKSKSWLHIIAKVVKGRCSDLDDDVIVGGAAEGAGGAHQRPRRLLATEREATHALLHTPPQEGRRDRSAAIHMPAHEVGRVEPSHGPRTKRGTSMCPLSLVYLKRSMSVGTWSAAAATAESS